MIEDNEKNEIFFPIIMNKNNLNSQEIIFRGISIKKLNEKIININNENYYIGIFNFQTKEKEEIRIEFKINNNNMRFYSIYFKIKSRITFSFNSKLEERDGFLLRRN